MLLPIGTDHGRSNRPTANYIIIILNFVIFLYTYQPHYVIDSYGRHYETLRDIAQPFMLNATEPHLYQFITYAFLHANWMHILGNMLFLYIFGNNVNDRMGNLGYILLYLGGAVFSGFGHALHSNAGVLGASGAIAAITGAYMVLLPKTNIIILYFFFIIGTLRIPAMYFILFKLIIFDNVLEPQIYGSGNIAHGAHLAGYCYGIAVPMILLALKFLPRSHFDLWSLFDRWKRRRQLRQVVETGYNPFGADSVDPSQLEKPLTPAEMEIAKLRGDISLALGQSRLEDAARKYLQLLELDNQQVLAQQQQIDIANKLMQMEKYAQAAMAYELFIKYYQKRYPFMEQIELMLGLIYSRYLNQKDKALKYLQSALDKLTDAGQKQLCREELARLKTE